MVPILNYVLLNLYLKLTYDIRNGKGMNSEKQHKPSKNVKSHSTSLRILEKLAQEL